MMQKNTIVRLCALLCLVAGLSAFGLACGDDGGGGGGDSECEEGELYATVGQETGCFTTCTGDAECGDGTCQVANEDTSICVGGSSNNNNGTNNNNGPDAGNNNPDTDNNNPDTDNNNPDTTNPDTDNNNPDTSTPTCGSGEVAADPFGDGAECYETCASEGDCTAPEECIGIGDGSTQICLEIPTGSATCTDIIDCQGQCASGDGGCIQDCIFDGTSDAQDTYGALADCANTQCPQGSEPGCIQDKCGAEFDACVDCGTDEIAIGFECAKTCPTGGECGTDETCVEPYLGVADEAVCSYQPNNFGDACTDDPDCGGPDPEVVAGGAGFCENSRSGPGNMCLAFGCNLGGGEANYGAGTGCGMEGYCAGVDDGQGGTIGLCFPLCREASDCPRGDTADYTCRIVVDNAEAGTVGFCEAACGGDGDCEFDGGNVQGRCNSSGYCEVPCEGDGSGCTDSGGTCDGNNFCVFE